MARPGRGACALRWGRQGEECRRGGSHCLLWMRRWVAGGMRRRCVLCGAHSQRSCCVRDAVTPVPFRPTEEVAGCDVEQTGQADVDAPACHPCQPASMAHADSCMPLPLLPACHVIRKQHALHQPTCAAPPPASCRDTAPQPHPHPGRARPNRRAVLRHAVLCCRMCASLSLSRTGQCCCWTVSTEEWLERAGDGGAQGLTWLAGRVLYRCK